ncbi:MAG: hypothetical protein EXR72_13565 [Myxococcales bacterium]|nr:hypothetical protein [Myxococcales bacterium]
MSTSNGKYGKKPLLEIRGGANRRDFIKYSVAVGALLGLDRWRIFEATESTAGKALATEMSCSVTNRSVHIIAGDGGFAWFHLLWPHIDVAAAKDPAMSFHAPGMGSMASGSDRPLYFGPEAPWKDMGAGKFVTAYMAGVNETHKQNPTSSSQISQGIGLFAACAALQASNPTLVPVIGVNAPKTAMPYGSAQGAPAIAQVGNADGLVDLFNSAASTATGALSNPKDAALYEAYYKGFLGLNAASGRSTYTRGLRTAKTASNLLGINLSSQLRPSGDDMIRYGVGGGGVPNKLMELAKGLITTAKSFKLGLTSCVILPAMEDDPHQAFADMGNLRMVVTALGKMLNAFIADLQAQDDPTCAGTKLADNVVISIHGDTPKDPLKNAGWPDGTAGNSNWCYAMGAGWLKTGWHGGILRDGKVMGFDPSTGKDVPGQLSAVTAQPAAAAIAYAVAKGDMRRLSDFYKGVDIAGIVNPKQM